MYQCLNFKKKYLLSRQFYWLIKLYFVILNKECSLYKKIIHILKFFRHVKIN